MEEVPSVLWQGGWSKHKSAGKPPADNEEIAVKVLVLTFAYELQLCALFHLNILYYVTLGCITHQSKHGAFAQSLSFHYCVNNVLQNLSKRGLLLLQAAAMTAGISP